MNRLRIGVPGHLAARPLVYGLTHDSHENVDLVYGEPGSLAVALERHELDAALIPSIEFLRGVGECSINGPALVARQPTGSLKLVVNKPIETVRSVAVAEFSRTPLVVLRVVLDTIYHILPDFWVLKAGPLAGSNWSDHFDGVLLDGDQGLEYCSGRLREGETCHDIDGMWFSLFATPLVLSLWAYNDRGIKDELEQLLVDSRDSGLRNLTRIWRDAAHATRYDGKFLQRFYHTAWGYDLGRAEQEGLLTLERFAHDYQLLQNRRLEHALVG